MVAQYSFGGGDRQITQLIKMYDNKDKYSGQQDEVFATKFATFIERCGQAGVKDLRGAFSTMLSNTALLYWRTNCQQIPDITAVAKSVQSHFETDEYRRNKLQEWNTISFSTELRKADNAGKPLTAIFNAMVAHMRIIQPGLPREYQSEQVLMMRITDSIQGVQECSMALMLRHLNTSALIASICQALGNKVTQDSTYYVTENETYYGQDRNFRSNHQNDPPINNHPHRPLYHHIYPLDNADRYRNNRDNNRNN
jgi:hypothetical protein